MKELVPRARKEFLCSHDSDVEWHLDVIRQQLFHGQPALSSSELAGRVDQCVCHLAQFDVLVQSLPLELALGLHIIHDLSGLGRQRMTVVSDYVVARCMTPYYKAGALSGILAMELLRLCLRVLESLKGR